MQKHLLHMKLIAQLRKDWRLLQETLPKENSKIECFIEEESAERLISFLIVAEDHRYKYHIGFDIIAIIRACFKLLINGKKEGASTIEQQLVRVVTNDYRYTLNRKIKEIILAILLKRIINKKRITEEKAKRLSLIAYYGTKYQSLDAILEKFDLTKSDHIDNRTCAEIIARLKYPEPLSYNFNRLLQINKRVQHILYLYDKHSKSKILII